MSQLETRVSTRNITWMDGDMVVLQPFDNLDPQSGTDFIARAGEGYLGSDGADENASYWETLCQLIGIDFSSFPQIISFPEGRRISAYWQGGVYTYATQTRLGAEQYEIISKLLSGNIGSRQAGVYHQDQVSIALAVQKLKLKHSEYSPLLNYNINPLLKQNAEILPLKDIRILHYHNSFYPKGADWALNFLEGLPADRLELIHKYVPFSTNTSYLTRAHNRLLRISRQRHVNQFKSKAVLY